MGWYRADVLGSRLAFTDRRAGFSPPPYDACNLSVREGDDEDRVAANRARATAFLLPTASPADWVSIRQVHGADVVGPGVAPDTPADGVVLTGPGAVAAIMVADCAPVAVVGQGGVTAIHAGWRGLVAGVVEAGVRALADAGIAPQRAVLGPSIRPCCYEFGAADLDAVTDRFGGGVRGTTTAGVDALDVPAAVRAALASAGVEAVTEIGACTACSTDYFSYRRDGAPTGRQALLAVVVPG